MFAQILNKERQCDAHKLVTQSVSIEFPQCTKTKETDERRFNWIRVEPATEKSCVGTLETSRSKVRTIEFTKNNMRIF